MDVRTVTKPKKCPTCGADPAYIGIHSDRWICAFCSTQGIANEAKQAGVCGAAPISEETYANLGFPFGPIPHWIKYNDHQLITGQWYIVTNGKESFAASWYGKNKWISQNMNTRNDITHYMTFPEPPNE